MVAAASTFALKEHAVVPSYAPVPAFTSAPVRNCATVAPHFRRYLQYNSEGLGDIARGQVVPLTILSSFAAPANCGYSEVLEQIGRVVSQSNRPSTLTVLARSCILHYGGPLLVWVIVRAPLGILHCLFCPPPRGVLNLVTNRHGAI